MLFELRLSVVAERLLVEGILQVLQGQSELEDGVVNVGPLLEGLAGGCGNCEASHRDCGIEFEGNHGKKYKTVWMQ